MQTEGENKKAGDGIQVQARFRVVDEDGSVVVRMVDGSLLRVGRIKVEGSDFKPAAKVLEKYYKGDLAGRK